MKKYILLFLVLTSVSSAQFPMVAAWQSSGAVLPPLDSLKGWYVAKDIADSLGKASGDTTYIWPNRAKWLSPYSLGDLYQTTSGNKPVYMADSNTVVFDGTDDFMLTPATRTYAQPYTHVVVLRYVKPQTTFAAFVDGQSVTLWAVVRHASANGVQIGANSTYISTVKFMSVDTVYSVTALYNGAASSVTLNNILWGAGAVGAGEIIPLRVGSRYDGAHDAAISVRAILFYSKELTAGELTQLNTYLNTVKL